MMNNQNNLLSNSTNAISISTTTIQDISEVDIVAPETVSVAHESVPFISEIIPAVPEADVIAIETILNPDEAVVVNSETDPVAMEIISIANRAVQIAPVDILVFSGIDSDSAKEIPIEDEGVPVAPDTDPITLNPETEKSYILSCVPCSMVFSNIVDFTTHSQSELHATMILATGIGFDELAGNSDGHTDSYIILYYCILCNFRCFHYKFYINHLKSKVHGRFAHKMKNFFEGRGESRHHNELIANHSSKLSVMCYCMLCFAKLSNIKCLKQHLAGKKHKNILPYLKKVFQSKKENVGISSYAQEGENISNSQYYCELCNISFNSNYYETHLNWVTHKRIEEYITAIFFGKGRNIDEIFENIEVFEKYNDNRLSPLYYCELGNAWCFGGESYERHLKGKKHNRKTKQKVNNTKASEYTNNQSPSIYHCDLCNIRCATTKSYKKHFKRKIHLRIHQLILENSNKKEEKFEDACFEIKEDNGKSESLPYYCQLCDTQCSDSNSYGKHLKGKIHKKIERFISKI